MRIRVRERVGQGVRRCCRYCQGRAQAAAVRAGFEEGKGPHVGPQGGGRRERGGRALPTTKFQLTSVVVLSISIMATGRPWILEKGEKEPGEGGGGSEGSGIEEGGVVEEGWESWDKDGTFVRAKRGRLVAHPPRMLPSLSSSNTGSAIVVRMPRRIAASLRRYSRVFFIGARIPFPSVVEDSPLYHWMSGAISPLAEE